MPPATKNPSRDDLLWCIPIAIGTSILLLVGRYGAIQTIATVLVVIFTAVTLWNVTAIQQLPHWQITAEQFVQGLSFGLPEGKDSREAIFIALATIGIIGVGAAELIHILTGVLKRATQSGRDATMEVLTGRIELEDAAGDEV